MSVSRRDYLKTTTAAVAGLAVGAAGGYWYGSTIAGPPAPPEKEEISDEVRVDTAGGGYLEAVKKNIIEPFEKKYGTKVNIGVFAEAGEVNAAIKASAPGEYDVHWPSDPDVYYGVVDGIFEPLRLENIPNYRNLMMPLYFPPYDPGPGTHSAAISYGTTGIVYNTKYVTKEEAKSYAVLYDPKYKGKIALNDLPRQRVHEAAMYLGQDPNNITDINAIYKKMAEQNDLVLKYWRGGAEMETLLTTEEAWLGDFWSGRVLRLKEKGLPFEYSIPDEGAITWLDALVVARGSKHRYTCEKFIDFVLTPEVQKNFAEDMRYPPPIKSSLYSSDIIKNLPDYDPTGTFSKYKLKDQAYCCAHEKEWGENFLKIKGG